MAEFCLEDGALNTTTCQESSSKRGTHTVYTHGFIWCVCVFMLTCPSVY